MAKAHCNKSINIFLYEFPKVMARVYEEDEFGASFDNLKLHHMVQLNDITDNEKRQLKHIHYEFPDRNEGDPGSCQIFCNDRHWGNENWNIKTYPVRVVTSWHRKNDIINSMVCWNFTVVSLEPQIAKKMNFLSIKEKLLEKCKNTSASGKTD